MIAFGMKSALICYKNKHFNYKGVIDDKANDDYEDENGLAIGSYKAALCAGVGATYVYKMIKKILDKLQFAGTYQDDGLTTFNKHLSLLQAIHWLRRFQLQVNKLVSGNFFQFTAE
eukprot:6689451-Ditylum_brightwellii.AAC.1